MCSTAGSRWCRRGNCGRGARRRSGIGKTAVLDEWVPRARATALVLTAGATSSAASCRCSPCSTDSPPISGTCARTRRTRCWAAPTPRSARCSDARPAAVEPGGPTTVVDPAIGQATLFANLLAVGRAGGRQIARCGRRRGHPPRWGAARSSGCSSRCGAVSDCSWSRRSVRGRADARRRRGRSRSARSTSTPSPSSSARTGRPSCTLAAAGIRCSSSSSRRRVRRSCRPAFGTPSSRASTALGDACTDVACRSRARHRDRHRCARRRARLARPVAPRSHGCGRAGAHHRGTATVRSRFGTNWCATPWSQTRPRPAARTSIVKRRGCSTAGRATIRSTSPGTPNGRRLRGRRSARSSRQRRSHRSIRQRRGRGVARSRHRIARHASGAARRARVRIARWDGTGARADARHARGDTGADQKRSRSRLGSSTTSATTSSRSTTQRRRRSSRPTTVCVPVVWRWPGACCMPAGDLAEADERLTAAVVSAPPSVRGFARVWLSGLRMHQGRLDEAHELVEQALVEGAWLGHPFARHHGHLFRVLSLGQRGRIVEALAATTMARRPPSRPATRRPFLGGGGQRAVVAAAERGSDRGGGRAGGRRVRDVVGRRDGHQRDALCGDARSRRRPPALRRRRWCREGAGTRRACRALPRKHGLASPAAVLGAPARLALLAGDPAERDEARRRRRPTTRRAEDRAVICSSVARTPPSRRLGSVSRSTRTRWTPCWSGSTSARRPRRGSSPPSSRPSPMRIAGGATRSVERAP